MYKLVCYTYIRSQKRNKNKFKGLDIMTEFENEMLQRLLNMKAKELQEQGKENFSDELKKISSKLIALECIDK